VERIKEHCVICGIQRGFSIYPTCAQESKLWSIPINKNAIIGGNPPQHVWYQGFMGTLKSKDKPTEGLDR
jgi:hypothetical protein